MEMTNQMNEKEIFIYTNDKNALGIQKVKSIINPEYETYFVSARSFDPEMNSEQFFAIVYGENPGDEMSELPLDGNFDDFTLRQLKKNLH